MPVPDPCALCGEPTAAPEVIALCREHLAVAAEVACGTDLLPAPCVLCGGRLGARLPSGWVCAVCEWPHGAVPDGELPRPRVDVVYYLALDERVKIGTTANPRQRFAALPHDRVLALERGGRALEQRRHRQFAADRLGGSEWFRHSPAIAAHLEALQGADDPEERWLRWVAEATAAR